MPRQRRVGEEAPSTVRLRQMNPTPANNEASETGSVDGDTGIRRIDATVTVATASSAKQTP
jgi:hypothetical protein